MTTPMRDNSALTQAIDALWQEIGLPRATPDDAIVPLYDIAQELMLVCKEVRGLTSQAAETFLLKNGGLDTLTGAASPDALAGFLHASADFGSLFVEAADPVTRRRFSAAHEIGHFVLHFRPALRPGDHGSGPLLDWATDAFVADEETDPERLPPGKMTVSGETDKVPRTGVLPPYAVMEAEANRFAAELLMPADVIRALAQRHDRLGRDDLERRLAAEMLVSRAAMHWRLQVLGIPLPL